MKSQTAPKVLAIYPTVAIWPANILRVHVVFDQPMDRRGVIKYISLLDEQRVDLAPEALLDLPDGLWTPDQRILTLLLHPGRVKTGLAAGKRYGPIFEEGRSYQWIIRGEMRDTKGQALGQDYIHIFQVGAAIQQGWVSMDGQPLPLQDRIQIETDRVFDFCRCDRI